MMIYDICNADTVIKDHYLGENRQSYDNYNHEPYVLIS